MITKEPRPDIPKIKIVSIGGFDDDKPDSRWVFDGSSRPKSVGIYYSKDWYLIGGYTVDELRKIANEH